RSAKIGGIGLKARCAGQWRRQISRAMVLVPCEALLAKNENLAAALHEANQRCDGLVCYMRCLRDDDAGDARARALGKLALADERDRLAAQIQDRIDRVQRAFVFLFPEG